jgi:hypothetical protein
MNPAATLRHVRQRFGVNMNQGGRLRAHLATRRQLPFLMAELNFTRGAEIGVWRGAYSAQFCDANPRLQMLCVDPWASYQGWLDTKNAMGFDEASAFIEQAYRDACERLAGLNCRILRQFSVDAAAEVPDDSLHFVYIDANHSYDAVLADLHAWSPKVRSGGIVCGHDYRIFKNKPTIHVVEAVHTFTRENEISPWFILAGDRTPSFLWVKW